ncbi:unnamed protein product [Menidia menidia]|uniref:(Atlantic silverside) hypothetical protein n=1 Tax=Menidia menidia TaxID=238744 RepID=A0A8S4AMM6_9TELE|nr:unnamed protein product [Menidia menidia]
MALMSVRHTEDLQLKTMISLLITVSVATDLVKGVLECNLTKPTETQQCVGALGEPLILHLPVNETIKTKLIKAFDGKFLQKTNISLKILAAVTQPAVSHRCLSAEQMTVSCSAEGDEVDFTLSLDNNILIHSRPDSTESQNLTKITITLHGQLVGKLVCDVQNNVSRKQTDVQVTGCHTPSKG